MKKFLLGASGVISNSWTLVAYSTLGFFAPEALGSVLIIDGIFGIFYYAFISIISGNFYKHPYTKKGISLLSYLTAIVTILVAIFVDKNKVGWTFFVLWLGAITLYTEFAEEVAVYNGKRKSLLISNISMTSGVFVYLFIGFGLFPNFMAGYDAWEKYFVISFFGQIPFEVVVKWYLWGIKPSEIFSFKINIKDELLAIWDGLKKGADRLVVDIIDLFIVISYTNITDDVNLLAVFVILGRFRHAFGGSRQLFIKDWRNKFVKTLSDSYHFYQEYTVQVFLFFGLMAGSAVGYFYILRDRYSMDYTKWHLVVVYLLFMLLIWVMSLARSEALIRLKVYHHELFCTIIMIIDYAIKIVGAIVAVYYKSYVVYLMIDCIGNIFNAGSSYLASKLLIRKDIKEC